MQNQYRAVMDSVSEAPFDPPMTPFEVTQRSFTMDQDVVLTVVQVLHLRNAVQKKINKRATRSTWAKPFCAQRGHRGGISMCPG